MVSTTRIIISVAMSRASGKAICLAARRAAVPVAGGSSSSGGRHHSWQPWVIQSCHQLTSNPTNDKTIIYASADRSTTQVTDARWEVTTGSLSKLCRLSLCPTRWHNRVTNDKPHMRNRVCCERQEDSSIGSVREQKSHILIALNVR